MPRQTAFRNARQKSPPQSVNVYMLLVWKPFYYHMVSIWNTLRARHPAIWHVVRTIMKPMWEITRNLVAVARYLFAAVLPSTEIPIRNARQESQPQSVNVYMLLVWKPFYSNMVSTWNTLRSRHIPAIWHAVRTNMKSIWETTRNVVAAAPYLFAAVRAYIFEEASRFNMRQPMMHSAVRDKNIQAVRGLHSLGFSVHSRYVNYNRRGPAFDTTCAHGDRPLHVALKVRDAKLVRELVIMGVDINATNDDFVTPLCAAVKQEQESTVRMLVDLGADIHRSLTLHYAVESGNLKIVRFLLGKCARLEDAAYRALVAYGKTPAMLALLIEKCKPNLDAADIDNQELLHQAAELGNNNAILLLLKCGADRYKTDKWGHTPMDAARTEEARTILAEAPHL